MNSAPRALRELWREARAEAPNARIALRHLAEYAAFRAWSTLMNCFPIGLNLRSARLMGRCWPLLAPRHLTRAVDHLRPSFPGASDQRLEQIARESLQHFAQVYLVEFVMTPRLVSEWTWSRYLDLDHVGAALRVLMDPSRGKILVTPHFGNFELMGYAMARVGVPITAVMRPLDNPLLNELLVMSRAAGGLSLVYKKGAVSQVGDTLAAGGALCFIADQDAGRKGVFVDFFNRPASWYRSIALLAMRHKAPIIVGHCPRVSAGKFRYRAVVERIIEPDEWADERDPVRWITAQYAACFERAIAAYPAQYLWMHRRWKSQPKPPREPAAAE